MNLLLPSLIAAVISVLFGSVAAAFVSHLLASRRAEYEFRLKKLEELYLAVEAASRNLLLHFDILKNVARGSISWADGLARGGPLLVEYSTRYAVAMMLCKVYFPGLIHPVELIGALEFSCKETLEKFTSAYKPGFALPEYAKAYEAAVIELKNRRSNAYERVFEAAEELRNGLLEKMRIHYGL